MRNIKLENEILGFIEKNEHEFVDVESLVRGFKKVEPLHIYDALVALRKNKKIERKEVSNYYYYKKL
jgi:hypothetical protein